MRRRLRNKSNYYGVDNKEDSKEDYKEEISSPPEKVYTDFKPMSGSYNVPVDDIVVPVEFREGFLYTVYDVPVNDKLHEFIIRQEGDEDVLYYKTKSGNVRFDNSDLIKTYVTNLKSFEQSTNAPNKKTKNVADIVVEVNKKTDIPIVVKPPNVESSSDINIEHLTKKLRDEYPTLIQKYGSYILLGAGSLLFYSLYKNQDNKENTSKQRKVVRAQNRLEEISAQNRLEEISAQNQVEEAAL